MHTPVKVQGAYRPSTVTPPAGPGYLLGAASTCSTAISAAVDLLETETVDKGPQADNANGIYTFPVGQNSLQYIAAIVSADGSAVGFRVYGWRQIISLSENVAQWVPTELWRGVAVGGARVGCDAGIITDTDHYADEYSASVDGGLSSRSTPTYGAAGSDETVWLCIDFGCNVIGEIRAGVNAADLGGASAASSFNFIRADGSLV